MLQSLPILYVEHVLARKIKYAKKYQRFFRQKVPSIADYVTGCYCRCRKKYRSLLRASYWNVQTVQLHR